MPSITVSCVCIRKTNKIWLYIDLYILITSPFRHQRWGSFDRTATVPGRQKSPLAEVPDLALSCQWPRCFRNSQMAPRAMSLKTVGNNCSLLEPLISHGPEYCPGKLFLWLRDP